MADTDVLAPYVPTVYPKIEDGLPRYFTLEHNKVEKSIHLIIQTMIELETRFSQPVSTYANRPASPTEGDWAIITDSSTATWGATVSGGGANRVLARYNGTNWTVVAV